MKAAEAGINETMNTVFARLDAETETDYWTCIVFQSVEQKAAFWHALGWDKQSDSVYISGTRLATMLGIPLPAGPEWKEAKVNVSLASLSMLPKRYSDDEP